MVIVWRKIYMFICYFSDGNCIAVSNGLHPILLVIRDIKLLWSEHAWLHYLPVPACA